MINVASASPCPWPLPPSSAFCPLDSDPSRVGRRSTVGRCAVDRFVIWLSHAMLNDWGRQCRSTTQGASFFESDSDIVQRARNLNWVRTGPRNARPIRAQTTRPSISFCTKRHIDIHLLSPRVSPRRLPLLPNRLPLLPNRTRPKFSPNSRHIDRRRRRAREPYPSSPPPVLPPARRAVAV
jgi:hypothetical protein